MIGESPEWPLWVMVGLLAFIMLLPIITSVSAHRAIVLPQTPAARRSAAVMRPRRFRFANLHVRRGFTPRPLIIRS